MDVNRELEGLNSFTGNARRAALCNLINLTPLPEMGRGFNMHCHSFFSYNADGWSPSRVAYECRVHRLCAAGLCDFDVLDGLEEFLEAGALLGLRTAVHLETRVFINELAEYDISSPGEPGVAYIMGCGFGEVPDTASAHAAMLDRLRTGAQERNLTLVERINAALPEIAIDYKRDVLPLTPRGTPTERHIVSAYRVAAQTALPDQARRAAFWSPLLKRKVDDYIVMESNLPQIEEVIRGALAKRGGIGYVQPDETTFPPAPAFVKWVRGCGAIPTVAWLDGTSRGEESADNLLDLMCGMGCAAVNIIPERNWNLKNPDEARRKQRLLDEIVKACQKRSLPINIGTEMNKRGLPLADDVTTNVLAQYEEVFTEGMRIMVGHTLLARLAQAPYLGERAMAEYGDIKKRNLLYAAIGAAKPITLTEIEELREAGPERAFGLLVDRARD